MGTFVMSLAGLDPSGGAGLLADIKTFEAYGLTGFGVCTALTVQTDDAFLSVEWLPAARIIAQAAPLLQKFPVDFCKIGIVASPYVLLEVLPALRTFRPGLQFILDPVLKASAGYTFHSGAAEQWGAVFPQLKLLTPNYDEAMALTGAPSGEAAAIQTAMKCAVLLKGGHRPGKQGWDTLYNGSGQTDFEPPSHIAGNAVTPKHGSGCVFSAAITASLAKGLGLAASCAQAKAYTYAFLQSSPSLLGHHQS